MSRPFPQACIPPSCREVLEEMRTFAEVRLIVAFGSRARGDSDRESDLDLAISAPGISRNRWVALRELADEARTLLWVNLASLDDMPDPLRRSVLATGVTVYESDKVA